MNHSEAILRRIANREIGRPPAEEFAAMEKIPVTVVLDNVRSAQNVGAFFRTGNSFAVEQVVLCGITATPLNRDIHKTALGAKMTAAMELYVRNVKDCDFSNESEQY